MSLARRLLTTGHAPMQPGQVQWTTPGTYSFVVPAAGDGVYDYDVHFISANTLGAGSAGSTTISGTPSFGGGGGGGNHWRNLVPVTPGETLTIEVGAANPGGGPAGGGMTRIRRGATVLLQAEGGGAFGAGGRGRFDLYGGGGGEGGNGNSGGGGDGGFGGGAGGYAGRGGRGGSYDYGAGGYPDADSGGGLGGNTVSPGNGWPNAYGQGVGLQGRNPGKTPGSLGLPRRGGGLPNAGFGASTAEADGGARIMWGANEIGERSYPDNAADV